MKKICLLMLFCASFFTFYNSAQATPLLQLDIVGGIYGDGTILGSGDLVALFNPKSGEAKKVEATTTGTVFHIVASNDIGGSVTLGTTTQTLTTAGVPDNPQLNHGELGSLGAVFDFYFDPTMTTTLYNTQDNAGTFGTWGDDGTAYYQRWDVDAPIPTHFDLYAYTTDGNPEKVFAPFSHDATHTPEPATMLLFGAGLAGLGLFVRKKKK